MRTHITIVFRNDLDIMAAEFDAIFENPLEPLFRRLAFVFDE
jgi:hypothetical protein